MKAAAMVLAFWGLVGLVVAWAFGIAVSADAGLWVPVGVLIAIPVTVFSVFLWWVFTEMP